MLRCHQPAWIISPMKSSRPSLPARLRVAAAQMKFRPEIGGNLAWIERAIARAAQRGAEVVLFPECATTGYAVDFSRLERSKLHEAIAHIGRCAERHRIHVLVGSPVFEGRPLFNALLVFDSAGRLIHRYAKCQLTEADRRWFTPGNALALFEVAGVPATAIICHERRYPELVRLPVMAGARIIFHPNAGLDPLAVSRRKRNGRDGIAVRAFENAVPYVFANSVGPQGGGRWSAGDSKIVAADGTVLRLAGNHQEALIIAELDLTQATGKYAVESIGSPQFLTVGWRKMIAKVQAQARAVAKRLG
jgi:predicted amidohydrolase